ncbi:hypothetical protein FOL47_001462 [Perkinsus chesapeaki]|uniref:Uncharacterized protein n=1 Tax=Perkinsus chesapeaki TaxID=330153 RepID=A0A7J6MIW6_PERCH|nr:hypothetical protein FOL47_001462 [Perkinsus chesapeaki]
MNTIRFVQPVMKWTGVFSLEGSKAKGFPPTLFPENIRGQLFNLSEIGREIEVSYPSSELLPMLPNISILLDWEFQFSHGSDTAYKLDKATNLRTRIIPSKAVFIAFLMDERIQRLENPLMEIAECPIAVTSRASESWSAFRARQGGSSSTLGKSIR